MTIRELIALSEMSQTQFAKHFGIPLRTLQNWLGGTNHCPPYLLSLIEYRIKKEQESR